MAKLDETAQAIIWKWYLPLEPAQDSTVMKELRLKRTRYFAIKRAAIVRLAELFQAAQRGEMDAERKAQRNHIHERLETYRRYLAGDVTDCGALPEQMEAALAKMNDQERAVIKQRFLTHERVFNWEEFVI